MLYPPNELLFFAICIKSAIFGKKICISYFDFRELFFCIGQSSGELFKTDKIAVHRNDIVIQYFYRPGCTFINKVVFIAEIDSVSVIICAPDPTF